MNRCFGAPGALPARAETAVAPSFGAASLCFATQATQAKEAITGKHGSGREEL